MKKRVLLKGTLSVVMATTLASMPLSAVNGNLNTAGMVYAASDTEETVIETEAETESSDAAVTENSTDESASEGETTDENATESADDSDTASENNDVTTEDSSTETQISEEVTTDTSEDDTTNESNDAETESDESEDASDDTTEESTEESTEDASEVESEALNEDQTSYSISSNVESCDDVLDIEDSFYSNSDVMSIDMISDTETWSDDAICAYDQSISDVTVTSNCTLYATVSIDKDAYNSLADDGDYLKFQGIIKIGDDWSWTQSDSYPYLTQSSFTENNGRYETSISFKFESISELDLKGIYFRPVAQGFAGNIELSDVYFIGEETTELEVADPSVIDDFEDAELGSDNGWSESSYQYDGGISRSVVNFADVIGSTEDDNSKILELGLDYSNCGSIGWSEAKIIKSFDSESAYDVSNYNMLTFQLYVPSDVDTSQFKAKVFGSNSTSGTIIDKTGTLTVESYNDAYNLVTVSVEFTPNTALLDSITIGIVGYMSTYEGNMYIDNIVLSQKDTSSDYVKITSVPDNENTTIANLDNMPSEVSLSDENATAEALELYSYLMSVEDSDQVLFGHQNDVYSTVRTGITSDTEDMTGSYSAIVGIDSLALTGAESGCTDRDAAIEKCVGYAKQAAEGGALITLSMHMPNMSNSKITGTENEDGSITYDFTTCDFNESKDLTNNCAQEVLPGGQYNEQFTQYLDIVADFANELSDSGIPILFRPFHECDGGWFWWGTASTDTETFKAMYKYAADYLRETKGVHNLVFVYSPNGPVTSESTYLDRYPGDDYVDILALDYYNDYTSEYPATYSEDFFSALKSSCEIIKGIADNKGKVAAIAETGVRVLKADGSDAEGLLVSGNPIAGHDWYQQISDIANEVGLPYYLVWANFSDTNFYVPYKVDETYGHELINEFIDFYNNESSVFADGVNFYNNATTVSVSNTNSGSIVNGYFTDVFAKDTIKEARTVTSKVSNASNVTYVLTGSDDTTVEIETELNSDGYYVGEITTEVLDSLGKTDSGSITLRADDTDLVTLNYICYGKDKEVLAANEIETFELYYGDDTYLNEVYTVNSASGCYSEFRLDKDNAVKGTYAGAFTYTLNTTGSEVWTGRAKGLDVTDYSDYNAISMWVKPDGQGQKLVIQLVSNEEDFEVYLNDFVATTEAKYITIPFSSFKGKNGGTFDPSNITKFAVWCNSIPGTETSITESQIVFDDIVMGTVDESSITLTSGGYSVTDNKLFDADDNEAGETSDDAATDGSSQTDTATAESGSASTEATVSGDQGTTVDSDSSTEEVSIKATKIKKLKTSGKKISVKFKRVSDATGYEIRYSTKKSFKSGVKTVTVKNKKSGKTITKTLSKGLKKGKKYYVQIRSYKTVNGVKYYSNWSSKKSVKIAK